MDYKNQITNFASRAKLLCAKLNVATKSDVIYEDVTALCHDMQKAIESCCDEMFYAAVYNARATIMTAPQKCPVSQLKDALCDAANELELMCQYFDNQNA